MATVASMWVKVGADIRDFQKNLTEGQKKAHAFARDMKAVGRTLTVAATLPIVAMGAASLKAASDFEAGLNRVQAVSGATASEFRALKKQAADLGATTQYTAGQAADAMGFLGMAGFRANEILGAMPGTLQLAAAAQIDLARSADIVTNILTGYGLVVEELGMANDVLVKTFTRTNTDLSMLGESFKYVGPIAKSAGVAFAETAAAIGLMGNAGIQGSMAGTSLRGAITRLLKPTSEVTSTLSRLGVSATDSEGRLLSLTEIVRQLEESGATTGDMMAIFGQRAGPAMAALVEQGSEALRGLVRELEASGGTAQRIAETQMKGLRGAMRELKSAVEALALAITGTGLLEGVTALAKQLAAFFRAVANLPRPVLQFAAGLAGLVAVMGPLLLVGAKVTVLFLQLKVLAAAVGIAIGTIAAPVAAAVVVLGGLGIALTSALSRAQKSKEATEKMAEAAREAARIEAQTPEGRAKQLRELEAQERYLTSRVKSLRDAAKLTGKAMYTDSANRMAQQLIQVRARMGELRTTGNQVAESITGAASAAGELGRRLEVTDDNFTRLVEAAQKARDTIADLKFEAAFTPAGEELDEINKKIAEMEERFRAVNSEINRFTGATIKKAQSIIASAPVTGAEQSINRAVPQSRLLGRSHRITSSDALHRGVGAAKMKAQGPTAVEHAQKALDKWLANPHITIASLERDPEFKAAVETLKRDRERQEAIQKAAGGGEQKGFLESIMSARSLGEAFGAVKTAVVASLKAAGPLIIAVKLISGAMEVLGPAFEALMLPIVLVGKALGSALVPVLKATWPVIRMLAVAVTYTGQALFTVAGWLLKGIGAVIEGLGKVVKWLTFGIVDQLAKAGKGMREFGDGLLDGAKGFADARDELRELSFEDALKRVKDGANRAAEALLNVPTGFKVAFARFQAARPEATVPYPGGTPSATPKGGTTTVQNHVPVTIHVHASERTDTRVLVQDIVRELQREANRGGVTGLELVFG